MPYSPVLEEMGIAQPPEPTIHDQRDHLAEIRVGLMEGDLTIAEAAQEIWNAKYGSSPSLAELRRTLDRERRRRFPGDYDWRADLGLSEAEGEDFAREVAEGLRGSGRAA